MMGQAVIAVLTGLCAWAGLHLYYFFRKEKGAGIRQYILSLLSVRVFFLFMAACAGMVFCYCRAVYYRLPYINCIRNEIVYSWLLIIALIDGREKLIPRALTTAGLAGWGILVAAAISMGNGNIRNILFYSGCGLLLGGGMFFVCRLLSKGGIGMGDIRMFSILGLLYGMNYTFSIIFFTVLLMSVFGLAAMLCKKKNFKSMIAMGPFTLAAYCICCFLGV